MKLVKMANEKRKIKISQREWREIGKKSGWLKEANILEGNKFDGMSSEDLRSMYLWALNDNQWLEQTEGGIDNDIDEAHYRNSLDEMSNELKRRKSRLASADSLIKESGHKLPPEFSQMLNELVSSGLIRIKGKIGSSCKIYATTVDPSTGKLFPPMPMHPTNRSGTLRNIVSRLKKMCPSFNNWPDAYFQGAKSNKKKNNKDQTHSCEKCGTNKVQVDDESSFIYIKCLEPSCGHTGMITSF